MKRFLKLIFPNVPIPYFGRISNFANNNNVLMKEITGKESKHIERHGKEEQEALIHEIAPDLVYTTFHYRICDIKNFFQIVRFKSTSNEIKAHKFT